MATLNHTTSATPNQDIEQLKRRITRAFLTYRLLQVEITTLEAGRSEVESYAGRRHTAWFDRIDTLYTRRAAVDRYIHALTAPAGGAE